MRTEARHEGGGHDQNPTLVEGTTRGRDVLDVFPSTTVLPVRRLSVDANRALPSLADETAVSVRADLSGVVLAECSECRRHPPPDYLTGDTVLRMGVWRITYNQDGHPCHRDTCGRWCSDWVLGDLLSDLDQPVTEIVLHVPTSYAPPGPRRAVRSPGCGYPIRRT